MVGPRARVRPSIEGMVGVSLVHALGWSAFAAVVATVAILIIDPQISTGSRVLFVVGAAVLAVPYVIYERFKDRKTTEIAKRIAGKDKPAA